MGITGIGYQNQINPYAAMQKEKTAKNQETGNLFQDYTAKKLEEEKKSGRARVMKGYASYDELRFRQIGKNAPDEVKEAWLEAAEEAGVDGMGMMKNGKITHITKLMAERATRQLKGEPGAEDILGNTVASARRAVEKALYDLEHPLMPDSSKSPYVREWMEKEEMFYHLFLKKLEG